MFDDGILKIYTKKQTTSNMGKITETLEFYADAFYGELSFGITEYYTAQQAQKAIEKRVRIHQDKSIGNQHVIILNDKQYQVGRTFSTVESGIDVTDITLERVTKIYDIV